MNFRYLTVLALLAFCLPSIHSSHAAVTDDRPNLEACTEVITARAQLRPPSGLGVLWTLFRLKFFPGSLVSVQTTRVPIAPELRTAPPLTFDQPGIIFSIEPPDEIAESPEVDSMRRRYSELSRLITAGLKSFRHIAGAKTVPDCMARADKAKFNFNAFIKMARERSALGLVEQIDEGRLTDKVIQGTLSHLKLSWRVVHSTDLMAVHEALRQPGLHHVVIVAHGLSGGKLVDSRLNEYPLGFFSEISPSLRSLSIFACHGTEMAKLYRVAEKLGTFKSQFAARTLFVSKGTKLGSLDEMVPVRAFRSFMTSVDHKLARAWRKERPVTGVDAPEARCSLFVGGLAIQSGSLGFILNGRFIGSKNRSGENFTLTYPCSVADRKTNILIIRNLSLLALATIATTDFMVQPDHAGHAVRESHLKHYTRADGSYQSSKFEFTLD